MRWLLLYMCHRYGRFMPGSAEMDLREHAMQVAAATILMRPF
jgi:hypothetical protein